MSKRLGFKLDANDYVELARNSYDANDHNQAIIYLKEALKIDELNNDARHFLAQIYQEYNLFVMSNEVLYKGLHLHKGEDLADYYSQLSFNFLQLKITNAVFYYLKKMDMPFLENAMEMAEDNMEAESDDDESFMGFSLVNPKTDNIYDDALKEAFDYVQRHEAKKALAILKKIPKGVRQAGQVTHLTMICYLLLGDHQMVINTALKFLRENDNLQVKCMLASTLMVENRVDEAYDVTSSILERDYTKLEDMLTILPVLINMEVHSQIVKYIKRINKELSFQPSMYLWLGQGLYNMGNKLEAEKTFNLVNTICGHFAPAKYYLNLIKENPKTIEYSEDLPKAQKILNYGKLQVLLKHEDMALVKDILKDETKELISFMFDEGNDELINNVVVHCSDCHELLEDLYREILIRPFLSHNAFQAIFYSFALNSDSFHFDCVTHGIFKEVNVTLPEAFWRLPRTLHRAALYAYVDSIYNNNDFQGAIDFLTHIIDDMYALDGEQTILKKDCCDQVSRFRDDKTLTFVLYARIWEFTDKDIYQTCVENNLNKNLFIKYYTTLFGDMVPRGQED